MCGVYMYVCTLYALWNPKVYLKNLPLCLCCIIFEVGLYSQSQSTLIRLVILASLLWASTAPAFQTWNYRQATTHTVFMLRSRALNSDPFACNTGVSATEPSPQPLACCIASFANSLLLGFFLFLVFLVSYLESFPPKAKAFLLVSKCKEMFPAQHPNKSQQDGLVTAAKPKNSQSLILQISMKEGES